ncbi:MAG: response regulator transcription factor [Flavobacteriales bacterium]|nr:response regulator transcription factor [Flavobacteriales bacterium]
MKTIKILFAEDHEIVRDGIKLVLGNQSMFKAEIDEACDGIEAVEMAYKKNYDIILLDINLPKRNGITVTKILKNNIKRVRILALSMHNEDFIIQQMIEAGALGYVLKNSTAEELITAIMAVATFGKYYCNDVTHALKSNLDKPIEHIEDWELNEYIPLQKHLSKREVQILKLIAQEFTNNEIAEKLKLSHRTVGNYRNKLLHKLQVKNSIGLGTFAVRNGVI